MANLRSRVTQATIGAVLVGALGAWLGFRSLGATPSATATATAITTRAVVGQATVTETSTVTSVPTHAPPMPTATPNCAAIPNQFNARGHVTSVNTPASTFRFRLSNGCSYTIVVTTGTQIQINGATPTAGTPPISSIQVGDRGVVQGLANGNGSIGALQINFSTDN